MNFLKLPALVTCLLGTVTISSSLLGQAPESITEPASQASVEQIADNSETKVRSLNDLPKLPTTDREQQIIDKIVGVVTTKYDSIEQAFSKLDIDQNKKLDRSEVSKLLRSARLSRIVRVIATGRLIDRYDVSDDDSIQWNEFNFAITKAVEKQARMADAKSIALPTPGESSALPVASK